MGDMKSFSRFLLIPLLALSSTVGAFAAEASPADAPVKLVVSVDPRAVVAGGSASATIKLIPKAGIKLNKYPKIKLQIPAAAGLIDAVEGSMGNSAPPPADNLDANYYHGEVDPLTVTFHVDAAAVPGRHEIVAKLSYFYCVAASGYCAPAKVPVAIPVTVR
jgi:hypothetical protein